MRSVCAVSRPVIRSVLRSQPIPQPTRSMSRLPQARCEATPGETWLEQHFRATDCHCNSYRVTTCSFSTDIRFFPVLTIATYSSHHAGHNDHQACPSRKKEKEKERTRKRRKEEGERRKEEERRKKGRGRKRKTEEEREKEREREEKEEKEENEEKKEKDRREGRNEEKEEETPCVGIRQVCFSMKSTIHHAVYIQSSKLWSDAPMSLPPVFHAVGRVTLQRAHQTHGQAANLTNEKCEAGVHVQNVQIKCLAAGTTLPLNGSVITSKSGGATTMIFIADEAGAASSFVVRSRPSRNMLVPPDTHTKCVQILADVNVADHSIPILSLKWSNHPELHREMEPTSRTPSSCA